MHENELMF